MQPAVIQWKTQMNATVVICMWSDVREEDNHISDSDSHNWQWGVVFFFFSFHATCLVNMRSAWHWNYHNYRLVTTRASHAEHSQYVLAVRAGTLAKLNFVLLTLWKKKNLLLPFFVIRIFSLQFKNLTSFHHRSSCSWWSQRCGTAACTAQGRATLTASYYQYHGGNS